MRCLSKDPAARYQTGRDLADALLEFVHEANARSPERVRLVRADGEETASPYRQENKSPTA
jgi:archaeosine-15-forming tRNA-guanine transglycosylase